MATPSPDTTPTSPLLPTTPQVESSASSVEPSASPLATTINARFPYPKTFLMFPPFTPTGSAPTGFLADLPYIPQFNILDAYESLEAECEKRWLMVWEEGSPNGNETMKISLYVYEINRAHKAVDAKKSSGDFDRMSIKQRKWWIGMATKRVACAVKDCEDEIEAHPHVTEIAKKFLRSHRIKVKKYRTEEMDFENEPELEEDSDDEYIEPTPIVKGKGRGRKRRAVDSDDDSVDQSYGTKNKGKNIRHAKRRSKKERNGTKAKVTVKASIKDKERVNLSRLQR